MRLSLLIPLFAMLVLLPSPASAAPDTSIANDDVWVEMKDVDDVGICFMVNGEKVDMVATCAWDWSLLGSTAGSRKVNLRSHLAEGPNFIVLCCFNKKWSGFGGKYSYDFAVKHAPGGKNASTFWSIADSVKDPKNEYADKMVYTRILKATVSNKGDVSLSKSIPKAVAKEIEIMVLKTETELIRKEGDIKGVIGIFTRDIGPTVLTAFAKAALSAK